MKKLFVCWLMVLNFSAVHAQNLSFYGFLPALNQTGRISKKLNYNFFASTTYDAFDTHINNVYYPAADLQLYIQPSIIYLYSPNLNFSASYTYQRNNPFRGIFTNEHRLWQQCIFSVPVSKARWTNRLRFEERFIEIKASHKYPLSTRARYQIGLNFPLQGRTLDKHEFYLNTYNEFYASLSGSKNATYSENWSYLGIGNDLGKYGRLELGYMLQTFVRNAQHNYRFLNLVQVMWSTNFNFGKKK